MGDERALSDVRREFASTLVTDFPVQAVLEQLQTELDDGPCRVADASGERVLVADLATDSRFPRFARRALDRGLPAVYTFPLRQPDHCRGALDLYRRAPGAMDGSAIAVAETLADAAAA